MFLNVWNFDWKTTVYIFIFMKVISTWIELNILKCIPVHSVTLKNILYIKNDPLIVPLKFCVEFLTYSKFNKYLYDYII